MRGPLTFLTAVLIAGFLVSLAACGGGGGGGDSFTPVSYTGSTTLATIDDTNAGDLAALAENGSSMGTIAPIPLSVAATDGSLTGIPSPVLQTITRLAKNLPGYLQNAPLGNKASLAAVSQSETLFCNGVDASDGSFFIAASWDAAAGTISASMTFSSCDEGFGEVLNGAVSFSMSGIVDDGFGNPDLDNSDQLTISQTYKNLSIYFPATNDTITIYSSMTLTIDATAGDPVLFTMNIHDMIMSQQPSGLTARIKNYNLSVIEYTALQYDEITIAIKAEVYDHVLGYVYFYTLPGFPIKEDWLTGPYEGIVRMEGANGSWAEVDFSITCDIPNTIYNGTFDDGTVAGVFCYMPTP